MTHLLPAQPDWNPMPQQSEYEAMPLAPSVHELQIADERLAIVDLPALFGERLRRLPMVLRLLLENVIRNTEDSEQTAAVEAIFAWLERGSSEAEIAFQPDRVLMHDTTSTPALVDIAAMRDALAEADSGKLGRVRELAEVIASRQEKALVFTQFRE